MHTVIMGKDSFSADEKPAILGMPHLVVHPYNDGFLHLVTDNAAHEAHVANPL